jgi:hypothetical protein
VASWPTPNHGVGVGKCGDELGLGGVWLQDIEDEFRTVRMTPDFGQANYGGSCFCLPVTFSLSSGLRCHDPDPTSSERVK